MDYHDIEWFALETNRDHSVIFETASKYCILDSFVDYLNAEFQRIARRDKKASLSNQCKEIEENTRIISVHFQGKPFNIMVIQAYPPTSNTEEAEVEQFYEDLQEVLELTHKNDVLLIIGDWNAKARRQETPGVTGKFGLGVQE